jgi:hypothetical protein
VNQALWQSDVCQNCCILFRDDKSYEHNHSPTEDIEHDDINVLMMTSELTRRIQIPTERALLCAWREAALFAERCPQRAIVGDTSQQLARVQTSSSAVPKIHNKFRSKIKISSKISAIPEPGIACSFTPWKEAALLPNELRCLSTKIGLDIDCDKRVVLRNLQTQCPVDFLRKHGLNGSEDLVLKKRNRTAILSAHTEWTTSQTMSGTKGEHSHLLLSILVLLNRMKHGSARTTVLLLHEDYPFELPVFGADTSTNGVVGILGHHVLCILGAVRDARDEEEQAIITAARMLGIRCVGANLGRTAEFTSKIIAALAIHAEQDVLGPAVDALPSIDNSTLAKLQSVRHEGCWDGKSMRVRVPAVSGLGSQRVVPRVEMRVVLWLAYTAEGVTIDLDCRERLLPLVQMTVFTLWRSRVASETAACAGKSEAEGDEGESVTKKRKTQTTQQQQNDRSVIEPTLCLVFSDGQSLAVTQRRMVETMAARHMGAPSEFNVLSALVEILANLREVPPEDALTGADEMAIRFLPPDLSKKQRGRYRVIELCSADSGIALEETLASLAYKIPCLCPVVLGGEDSHEEDVFRLMVLLPLPSFEHRTSGQVHALRRRLLCWRGLDEGDNDDSALHTCKLYTRLRVCSDMKVTLPSAAIAILQHWAYHGLLRSSVRLASTMFSRQLSTYSRR